MVWRQLVQRAREDATGWIGDALEHRRNHPGLYALAHAYAATHYRLAAEDAERRRKRARAGWLSFRAMIHRQRRRHFERLAKATAEASECACMLEKLGDM